MKKREEEINILHLSDLHFGIQNSLNVIQERKDQRNEGLLSLIEILKNLDPKWHPHIIAISGDIGWSGKSSDYVDAGNFINSILALFNLKQDKLVISAGNHDINRDHSDIKILPLDNRGKIDCFKADDLLGINELEDRMRPFGAFISFLKANKIRSTTIYDKRNFLIGFRNILGLRFVVLNSAWFQEDRTHTKGNLFIGLPHIKNLSLKGNLVNPSSYDKDELTVVLLHHPPEYLHENELDSYNDRPATYEYLAQRSHIILSGHSHGEKILNPDRKYFGALLFKLGTTAINHAYKNNCEILKINKEKRNVNRIKLYYEPGESRWRLETDDFAPYNLNRKILEELQPHEITHRIMGILREHSTILKSVQEFTGLTPVLEVLSTILPLKLPIIRDNSLNISKEMINENKELHNLVKLVENLDKIQPEYLDLNNDWLSQRVWYLAGNFWYFLNEFEKASAFYNQLVNKVAINNLETEEPAFRQEIFELNRGVILAKIRSIEALEAFDKAIEIKPTLAEAHLNKSSILIELGMFLEAIKCSDETIKLNPSIDQAWINKANALMRIQDYNRALEICNYCIRSNMNLISAYLIKGMIQWDTGLHSDAKNTFQKILDLPINYPEDIFNKATALIRTDKVNQAIQLFDRLFEQNFDKEPIYINKGAVLMVAGNFEEALSNFDNAIKYNPYSYNAYQNKSLALFELGKNDEALDMCEKVIEINPRSAKTWILKAQILSKMGNFKESNTAIDMALKINPQSFEAVNFKGFLLLQSEKYSASYSFFNQSVKINPSNAVIWFSRGVALSKLGKNREAIKSYNEAIKLQPNYLEALYNKALCFEKIGKYKEAIKAFEKIIKISPDDPKSLLHLAACYSGKKKYELGITYLIRAIESDENVIPFIQQIPELRVFRNDSRVTKLILNRLS